MKAKIKLGIGVTCAALAMMAISQAVSIEPPVKKTDNNDPCYTKAEVQLLMKSNHWTKQEAESILDMACKFSKRH